MVSTNIVPVYTALKDTNGSTRGYFMVENPTIELFSTNLSADYLSLVSGIVVTNATWIDDNVSFNTFAVINGFGNATSELVRISSTSGDARTLTITPTLQYTHKRGGKVSVIPYSTIVIEGATTIDGSYTLVKRQDIDFQSDATAVTIQFSSNPTYKFYRMYFSDWEGTTTTLESSAAIYSVDATTASNTQDFISSVRTVNNVGIDISDSFIIECINDARDYIDSEAPAAMRSWNSKFDYPRTLIAGTNFVELPSDIRVTHSNKSLLRARIVSNQFAFQKDLNYVDKANWNYITRFTSPYTVVGNVSSGATSIVLDNTSSLGSFGSISIAAETVSQDIMVVTFTANDKATNTLTVTGSTVTRSITSGTQAWNATNFSYPQYYTVFDGKIWLDYPVSSQLAGSQVYLDYYKTIPRLTSIQDEMPEEYYNIYKPYIAYRLKKFRDKNIKPTDIDYAEFRDKVKKLHDNSYNGQYFTIEQSG